MNKYLLAAGIVFFGMTLPRAGARPPERPSIPLLFVNQCAYHLDGPKRFTAPTLPDGTPFTIRPAIGGAPLFRGTITRHIGDFTAFRTEDSSAEFVIKAGELRSDPFCVTPHLLERHYLAPALCFMVDARSVVGTHPSAYGGMPWRDGTYYSFEVPSLVLLYLADPGFFHNELADIRYAADKARVLDPAFKLVPANGDKGALEAARRYYTELDPPVGEHVPAIVQLIHWGIGWHLMKPESADPSGDPAGRRLHPQTVEQFAFFLHGYPRYRRYFTDAFYRRARDFAFAQWEKAGLLDVITTVGDFKGREAPGHSILPNLMMHAVAEREKRRDAGRYLDAAVRQARWIVETLDPADPKVTKGQRMSEHKTITGLTALLRDYPARAPAGLQGWLEKWADVVIARSDNLWDFRRYDDENWSLPRFSPGSHGGEGWNEPGNVAGFPACALAVAELLDDPKKSVRLWEIATAHFDALFGRNPLGAHSSYRGPSDFWGVERGWPKKFPDNVCARLELVRGALNSSASTEQYPYNPAGAFRHSEGWTAFNAAFNVGLAYACREGSPLAPPRPLSGKGAPRHTLADRALHVTWRRAESGWRAVTVAVRDRGRWVPVGAPSGEYAVVFSEAKPDARAVVQNTAGTAYRFLPNNVQSDRNRVRFTGDCEPATVTADWSLDPRFPGDLRVTMTLKARRRGYFSLATPTLTELARDKLAWGMIPGYWQGTGIQHDFVRAFQYGQGIPDRPVLARERTATTLAPLLSTRAGGTVVTTAAIPEPGTGRDPWESGKNTHGLWRVGLSLMDRAGGLAPTLYAPVLGEAGSLLEPGQTIILRFRYCLRPGDWTGVYRHAVEDVYRFADALALKRPERSLTERLKRMQAYVDDAQTSLWQTDDAGGQPIGAQSYLGVVKGARTGEAMKNSDLGALWMLARITGDPTLGEERLPLVRGFKLAQQETGAGFFRGAALGQYWLREQNRFVEEWGPYVEPIGLTYYTLIDIGNILLFQPEDAPLRERLRLGAETLLRWQKPDGSWDVAYDRETHAPAYPHLTDLRPTWYGLLVAWRIVGDQRYLEAARRGADWFLRNAVAPGHYLGVCGDVDFVMDFATGQSAQCLLDLYAATRDPRYRDAAITVARLYWTWTYTHPAPTTATKTVKGRARADWEITQAGLSMEHGGTHGSANGRGPILLCSHAGMFVRFYEMTGERLFIDMARHAALGRDAFVDTKSGVASYYWADMDAGPGRFPHHAWWQIGWIMDYLLAEARLRSAGKIDFPRGFVTPKVGPQQSVGFAMGTVFGKKAALWMPPALLRADSPAADTLGALSPDNKTLFVLVLSESAEPVETTVAVDSRHARPQGGAKITGLRTLAGRAAASGGGTYRVRLAPYGIAVLALALD